MTEKTITYLEKTRQSRNAGLRPCGGKTRQGTGRQTACGGNHIGKIGPCAGAGA